LSLTSVPKKEVQFAEYYNGTGEEPSVTVKNQTNRTLNLRVGDDHYSLAAGLSKVIKRAPGIADFYASVPGAIPAYGTKNWKTGYEYSWTFWVETKPY
jgi:hypothetical protein